MTQIEKAMNKDDLKAWKNYDNTQYSLIPGVNSIKKFMQNKLADGTIDGSGSPRKNRSIEELQNRMENFGYVRDVRKIDGGPRYAKGGVLVGGGGNEGVNQSATNIDPNPLTYSS